MTVSASTQIPKSSDPVVFQRQCKVLFEHILKDPGVKEYGTSGQAQHGIDILGRRRDVALDHWVGIQCKLTIKSEKLSKTTVRKEATAALAFEPTLKELIVVTTAPDDAALDAEAATFTDEQAKLGRDFTVQVWGWGTLETHILQYEETIQAFSPDAFPHMRQFLKGQDRLSEQVSAQNDVLIALHRNVQSLQLQTTTLSAQDSPSLDTILDKQIDQCRDLLNDGNPTAALKMLDGLWDGLPSDVGGRVRYRIKANIGACKLRLGKEEEAGRYYLEAYDFAPAEPKAIAFKVFGLILIGLPDEAYKIGLPAIATAPEKVLLVAYTIMAAKMLPHVDDTFGCIPRNVESDPIVVLAKIDYLRTQRTEGDWWDIAKEAYAQHPEDENLARSAADAAIDQACRWSDENKRAMLPSELRQAVEAATTILLAQWERVSLYADRNAVCDVSLCANLSTAYRLLHNFAAAKKVIEKGLAFATDEPALLEHNALIALEEGDAVGAASALERLPRSRNRIFGQLQIFANGGNWPAIAHLASDTDISLFSTADQAFFEAVVLVARINLGECSVPRDDVTRLLSKYPEESIVPIVLYEVAYRDNDRLWSVELFREAKQRAISPSFSERLMLARVAEREDDPGTIIGLLQGNIPLEYDSDELRLLARSFVNAPPQKDAVEFAKNLSDALKREAFYARVVGSIHFNCGDLPEAENAFRAAIIADPIDLNAQMGLINALMRRDRHEDVERLITALDPSRLQGPVDQKMRLSQLLVHFGRLDDGLAYGYKTAISNRDDARANLLYMGLFLPDPKSYRIPAIGECIAEDCTIELERHDGKRLRVTIEAGAERPSIDHYSPEHSFAKSLMGAKKDDVVVYEPAGGSVQQWHVLGFKHKYLALLHEIMETFPARFPDVGGFYVFEFPKGDVSPILEEVKAQSQTGLALLEKYVSGGFPLAVVGALLGHSTVETAGQLLGRGYVIKTCAGTDAERGAAIEALQKARETGIVLDAYTAWCAYSFDQIPTLKSLFPRVVLPQSSLDELRVWRERYRENGEEPLMTIGYANGEFFREEISPDRLKKSASAIEEGIETIRREFEILPAAAPGNLSEIESKFFEVCHRGFLDPVYISISENIVLLSEDLHFRNLSQHLYQRNGAWLQAVMILALREGVIDFKTYARSVVFLAAQKHDYVTVNEAVLITIAEDDVDDTMPHLAAALAFIGTQSADIASHSRVGLDFLLHVWDRKQLSDYRKAHAAGMMLERLMPMLSKHAETAGILRKIISQARHHPRLQLYIAEWARGHFIALDHPAVVVVPNPPNRGRKKPKRKRR